MIKHIFLMFLLVSSASGVADEVIGRVTNIVDGDTFDVAIESADRPVDDLIRVRLADIDCPETRGAKAREAGKAAKEYTRTWLLSRTVSLDLDDKTGQDRWGRWVALCYLDGKNFNDQLVESGHAVVKDYRDNEF